MLTQLQPLAARLEWESMSKARELHYLFLYEYPFVSSVCESLGQVVLDDVKSIARREPGAALVCLFL